MVGLGERDGRSVAGVWRAADDPVAAGVDPATTGRVPDLPPPVPSRSEMPTIAVSVAAISEAASYPDGPRAGSRSGKNPVCPLGE